MSIFTRKKTMLLLTLAAFAAAPVHAKHFQPDVRPGYGVTAIKWLSDYNTNLKDSEYDTPVYVMEGKKPGVTALIFAGTHAREIAGPISTTVLLENARVEAGKLFVIPCLNAAGMAVPDTLGQVPHDLIVEGRNGKRVMYYGDRRIPLRSAEKDPEHFRHPTGYIHKDGSEWRNINRNYPGRADGTPAQQVCFGMMELIRREKVATCFDVHEATPTDKVLDPRDGKEYEGGTLAYSVVTHPKYINSAVEIIMEIEDIGVQLKAERSNPQFRGISHFEIGENTSCIPFLSETPNPAMHPHAVGADPLHDRKYPIEHRVGITMEIFRAWFAMCPDLAGGELVVEGMPTKQQIEKDKLRGWLN